MLRPAHLYFLCGVLLLSFASQAQYHGDDIPGSLGLQSGTMAPPGLYIRIVLWVYPTDTIKDEADVVGCDQRIATKDALLVVELPW